MVACGLVLASGAMAVIMPPFLRLEKEFSKLEVTEGADPWADGF